MNKLFKFSAYNSQALYGWGDENEADAYCDHLNRNREINVYSFAEVTDEDEIAKRDDNAEGVNLADALVEIENETNE